MARTKRALATSLWLLVLAAVVGVGLALDATVSESDMRQAQGEATIVFVKSNAVSEGAAQSEGESESAGEAEGESDAEAGAESETETDTDTATETEAEAEGQEVLERGTLLLSDEEQNQIADSILQAVEDTIDESDAAETEAEAADAEVWTEADEAASRMRFAHVQMAARARGFFDRIAKAAKSVVKSAAKAASSAAGAIANFSPMKMALNLAKKVGGSVLSKVGTKLIDNIGTKLWDAGKAVVGLAANGVKALTDAEPGRRTASDEYFPKSTPLALTNSLRNRRDYGDVTAHAPSFKSNRLPEDVEDCVACRYVWLQVEMDVGNSAIEETVYDSFYQNALEAQKTPIFYPGCQTMFDQIDDMLGDYMDGYSVDQLCENSMLCR